MARGSLCNLDLIGPEMVELMAKLYPICRSITGDGVRETLNILKQYVPVTITEVPSGTPVFDWTVPKEWNIEDAYIRDAQGKKIVDFKKNNLHVLNYSIPINQKVSLDHLKEHLYTLPDKPGWIPYRTTYYNENWGFCIAHDQYRQLPDGEYQVCIDSTLKDGALTFGELLIKGESEDEFLLSCHVCHPSLCNDNLSGIALSVFLARSLMGRSLKYSYRFLFIPGTIGSITWLALNQAHCPKIKHGLVVNCVGDSGKFIYKRTRQHQAEIDRAVIHILKNSGFVFEVIDFFPYGYDERQFCSPGFDLPVGCLSRSTHGRYPEYHTSADNFDIITPSNLMDSFSVYHAVIGLIENDKKYLRVDPFCEPQLGKRGLYDQIGARSGSKQEPLAMLWVLNLSDGRHSLLDMAERSGLDFSLLKDVAQVLQENELIR
jgi:aminopeptidase-like protein